MFKSRGPKKNTATQKATEDGLNFVMIDIGSGLGNRAAQWLKNNKDVHVFCFDPLEECYVHATQLANREKRMHVFKTAVSSRVGDFPFYCTNDLSSCSLLPLGTASAIKTWKYPPGKIHFKTTDVRQVQTTRMDKFLIDRRITRVMFVRVETQGTALDVVRSFGDQIGNVMEFAIKVHVTDFDLYQNQTHKTDLVEYMNECGFSIYDLKPQSQNQEEVIWFVNRSFVKKSAFTHNDL